MISEADNTGRRGNMIIGNKIAHDWMTEYVTEIQSIRTAKSEEILKILDKANQYRFRLVEMLGEDEFNNHLKQYVLKYNRLGFLR